LGVFRNISSELPRYSEQRITLLFWLPQKDLFGLPFSVIRTAIFAPKPSNSIWIWRRFIIFLL